MFNLFLALSFLFLFTFVVGRLIEKVKVPWVFSALILGLILSIYNPYPNLLASKELTFLGDIGMYLLLFIIGLELNLKAMKKLGRFILKSTFIIILFEVLCSALLVHYAFYYNWFTSFVVALSFATVGEAILIPILDEFKIINTKLGQTIIGIGTLDDIFEVIALMLAMVLIGKQDATLYGGINLLLVFLSLSAMFALTFTMKWFKRESNKFSVLKIETIFVFLLFILFLFLGIGAISDAQPVGALLAGIAVRIFLPSEKFKSIESELKTMTYGFFVPIFFVLVGASMNMSYILESPLLILLVIVVTSESKLVASYIVGRKELGIRSSTLLGIGLSVRFSTSIIIIKLLFENGVIHQEIYSVLIASTIIFTLFIPLVFSNLLVRWKNESGILGKNR